MTNPLECYFDYRSPFPFLAIEPIAALALKHSVDVDWIPIRLPKLSSYRDRPMGHSFPKRNVYVARDLQRWAERRGVVIRAPGFLVSESATPPASVMGRDHPMDTDALLRGAVVARRLGLFDAYHRAAYQALWGSGVDAPLDAALARGIEAIDQNPSSFRKSLESKEIGDELAGLTEAADERGVFGVPTFFVEDEMFWGQDRIDFVEEALSRA